MSNSTTSSHSDTPPPDMPLPSDHREWDTAAEEFRRNVLDKVRASAGVWAGGLTTLLGLFGTVALVTGPTEVAKLSGPIRVIAIAGTVVAGALAAAAVLLATQAQELPDLSSENWNGRAYQSYVMHGAMRARQKLARSRLFGLSAVGVLFLLGVIVMIDSAVQ
jgi:hypothetical protein